MKTKKQQSARQFVITLLISALLIIPLVAASGEFTASGTARILATACSTGAGTIQVTNKGDTISAYRLSAEGPAREWVQFEPDAFVLMPGQSITVNEFLDLPCNAEDAPLDVAITTEDAELVLSQDIIVQPANNLILTPIIYAQTIQPCGKAEFSLLLQNPEDFIETYRLGIENAPEKTTLSDESITLSGKTNETIIITTRPTDCTLSGEFVPTLSVTTEKSRLKAEIDLYLRINTTGIPEIAPGTERIRADYEPQEAVLDIINKGDQTTTYALSVDGEDWVSVQPEDVTIKPRDKATVKLVIKAGNETPAGKYTITLNAKAVETNNEYSKELTIKLGTTPFDTFTESTPLTIATVILAIIIVILAILGVRKYRSPEFQARLAERREQREKARQERLKQKEEMERQREEERRKAEAIAAKEAARAEKRLERERAKAQREYERELKQKYHLIAKDETISGSTQSKAPRIIIAIAALLIIAIIAYAFRNVLVQNYRHAAIGLTIAVLIAISHMIRTRRTPRGKWKIAHANKKLELSTKWKRGLAGITFKLNTVVRKLAVAAKKCKTAIPPPQHAYQTFVLKHNAEEENIISSATITFKVKKSWLSRKNSTPGQVKLLRLDNNRWQNIPTTLTSTDDKHAYYTADADNFGEFAIVAKTLPARKAKKEYSSWAIALFCIVGVIALVSLALLVPETSRTPTIGIPSQVWQQNTQKVLDLNQYFKDPDNDKLTFTATRTENIDITITPEGKAILTPKHNWRGTERTVFIATDTKGGTAKSNTVNLVVEKPLIPQEAKQYAKPALITAIILLAILGLIIFRKPLKRAIKLK